MTAAKCYESTPTVYTYPSRRDAGAKRKAPRASSAPLLLLLAILLIMVSVSVSQAIEIRRLLQRTGELEATYQTVHAERQDILNAHLRFTEA